MLPLPYLYYRYLLHSYTHHTFITGTLVSVSIPISLVPIASIQRFVISISMYMYQCQLLYPSIIYRGLDLFQAYVAQIMNLKSIPMKLLVLVIVTQICILWVAKICKKGTLGISAGSWLYDRSTLIAQHWQKQWIYIVPTNFVPWVADTFVILIKRLLLLALFVRRFPVLAGFVV